MRKESYQRSQSKLQGEVDGLKSHISKQDEQRARGLDGVIHEVQLREKWCRQLKMLKLRATDTNQARENPGENLRNERSNLANPAGAGGSSPLTLCSALCEITQWSTT